MDDTLKALTQNGPLATVLVLVIWWLRAELEKARIDRVEMQKRLDASAADYAARLEKRDEADRQSRHEMTEALQQVQIALSKCDIRREERGSSGAFAIPLHAASPGAP